MEKRPDAEGMKHESTIDTQSCPTSRFPLILTFTPSHTHSSFSQTSSFNCLHQTS